MKTSLKDQLRDYVAACFSGLWISTQEADEALADVAQVATAEGWRLIQWDFAYGITLPGGTPDGNNDPAAPIRTLLDQADGQTPTLLVLHNYHRFIDSPDIMQHIWHAITKGKQSRAYVVVLSPVVRIPVELEKLFVVLTHELPDQAALESIARGLATEPGELPEDSQLSALLNASAGLTRYEAEGSYSLSIVQRAKIDVQTVWELKESALRKSGLLELWRPPQDPELGDDQEAIRGRYGFGAIGGLDSMKSFCFRALTNQKRRARAKGILLLGPAGTGKSSFAKALGIEVNRPTVILDAGRLMGSLVGQTEERTRQALAIVDAMAPCVLFLDEVEKALAGGSGGGNLDSGVTSRMFGSFLTWLNDHTSDVFTVCTCNKIASLPPEFSRSGRFNATFFIDLPGPSQREDIWQIYLRRYGLDQDQPRPDDSDWTGAEILGCCEAADLLGVSLIEAARSIVPVAVSRATELADLRNWAAGKVLSADYPGTYTRTPAHANNGQGRAIVRNK